MVPLVLSASREVRHTETDGMGMDAVWARAHRGLATRGADMYHTTADYGSKNALPHVRCAGT